MILAFVVTILASEAKNPQEENECDSVALQQLC